mmetsp:Transcript_2533/g.2871  ORF Transcript_2533/g.2871 Transcript_2533/m.2871 type:complete len:230 (-) Transcript_2533:243-932(-)
MLRHLLAEHLGDSIDAGEAGIKEDRCTGHQLGMQGIHQCHGVGAVRATQVDHAAHHQDPILHGGVRSMSTHHGMCDGVGAMEMIQGFDAPLGALHPVHRHTIRTVIRVHELSGQTFALAVGHQKSTAGVPRVVRVEPDHGKVLEAALANVNEIGAGILQGLCRFLGAAHCLHRQLLGLVVELAESHTSQVVVHHFLEAIGALGDGIPPSRTAEPHHVIHRTAAAGCCCA